MESRELTVIARVKSDFGEKFGVPRQSGRIPSLTAEIVFEEAFRSREALRGIEQYSHLWILWGFSANRPARGNTGWHPTVRPPRLGGNVRVGVFATRSPFRPNPIGLSAVRLLGTREAPGLGTVLRIAGGDMMDGTPVYDIKPYLPRYDAVPDAEGGFSETVDDRPLTVSCPPSLLALVPEEKRQALLACLSEDPRPSYQDDPERVYGFTFAGLAVRFRVENQVLTVVSIA